MKSLHEQNVMNVGELWQPWATVSRNTKQRGLELRPGTERREMLRKNRAWKVEQTLPVHYKIAKSWKPTGTNRRSQNFQEKKRASFQINWIILRCAICHTRGQSTSQKIALSFKNVALARLSPGGKEQNIHMYNLSGSDREIHQEKQPQSGDSEAITGSTPPTTWSVVQKGRRIKQYTSWFCSEFEFIMYLRMVW